MSDVCIICALLLFFVSIKSLKWFPGSYDTDGEARGTSWCQYVHAVCTTFLTFIESGVKH